MIRHARSSDEQQHDGTGDRGAYARPKGRSPGGGLAATVQRWRAWSLPLALFALTLGLDAWRLADVGYGNTYYAAAVRSMTLSWSNFFFGAFDPGGFISVDKPPAFLWVGALSARVFGYSSWSILLPSAFAGAATVVLLWLIVRRYFGAFAATIAGLVLALTPITVAVSRLNLPEPFFILALVGGAGALLRSLESRRWWAWAALAGVLVGVAFNAKMLAAWIPGPALALVAGAPWSQWRALAGRLAVLGAATVIVSASWMVITDAWPASQRPYIGGSTDNSVANLVFGYNGLGRVDGENQARGGGGARGGGAPPPGASAAPGTGTNTAPRADGGAPGGAVGGAGGPGGAVNGAGGIIAGRPGPWRMLDAANGGQIAWLLPFALLGGGLALWTWRRDRLRRGAAFLWLGWVLLYAGVFSFALGIYTSYYTAALAPGVAALAGIGALAAADAVRRDRRWLLAPLVLAVATVAVQIRVADRVPEFYGWLRPMMIAGVATGVLVIALGTWPRVWPSRWAGAARPHAPGAGMAVVVTALLLIPGAWSVSEASNASLNTTLPQAGPRGGAAGRSFGSQAFDDGTTGLAEWLRAHADGSARWDLAVTSAQAGSTLIARDSLAVMAMGGFLGSDPAMTNARFADLVAAGDVRYVLVDGGGPGGAGARGFAGPGAPSTPPTGAAAGATGRGGGVPPGTPPRVAPGTSPTGTPPTGTANAVLTVARQACTPVTDTTLPARYRGALYDCAGKAGALRASAAATPQGASIASEQRAMGASPASPRTPGSPAALARARDGRARRAADHHVFDAPRRRDM